MAETHEAAIVQSFMTFQAIKHGDRILKALPALAPVTETRKQILFTKKVGYLSRLLLLVAVSLRHPITY